MTAIKTEKSIANNVLWAICSLQQEESRVAFSKAEREKRHHRVLVLNNLTDLY